MALRHRLDASPTQIKDCLAVTERATLNCKDRKTDKRSYLAVSDETQKDPAANPSGDQMRWLPIAIVLVGVAGAAVWGYYFKNTRTQRSGGCAKVLAACKAAGFKRGRTAEERRSFFESCVKPLTEHTKLGDIQIDAESAAACKTRLSRRRQQRDS